MQQGTRKGLVCPSIILAGAGDSLHAPKPLHSSRPDKQQLVLLSSCPVVLLATNKDLLHDCLAPGPLLHQACASPQPTHMDASCAAP